VNKFKVALAVAALAAFFGVAVWIGNQTHAARKGAEGFFISLEAGEIPADISDSVRLLAEDLLEFGDLTFDVGKVRLAFPNLARAEATLIYANQKARTSITLGREKGQWQPVIAPDSELEILARAENPELALRVGATSLTRELRSLRRDKLLTLQGDRAEWLEAGWLELAPYFTGLFQAQRHKLLVGMEEVELFGHGDRLAAAVLREKFVPGSIRVNISTTGHDGIRHGSVQLTSPGLWQVTEAGTGRQIDLAQGTINLSVSGAGILLGSQEFGQRLIFTPQDPEGQLQVSSITRSGKVPSYHGSIEVANFDGDLVIVNELPLEQYLWYVVPSEMPASFGRGALEVQAIVARTFALANLYASAWQSSSAHVVDSVLSQVYNNSGTNAAAIAAVDATRGEYIVFGDGIADVRFFSTSCGYTGNAHEVWPDSQGGFPGVPTPWLTSIPQYPGVVRDIGSEEGFADFIHNPPADAYDAGSAWFRWQLEISVQQLRDIIIENLKSVHASNPKVVLELDSDGKFIPVASLPQDPVGELVDIIPGQRGEGGVLMAVDIVGSHGTWRVQREYYIRHVLRPQGNAQQPIVLRHHDGSTQTNFSLLPSAYVVWERLGPELDRFRFSGGGFGHGVGMSQYGVRYLVARGWSREQVIQHYFPGVTIQRIQ